MVKQFLAQFNQILPEKRCNKEKCSNTFQVEILKLRRNLINFSVKLLMILLMTSFLKAELMTLFITSYLFQCRKKIRIAIPSKGYRQIT